MGSSLRDIPGAGGGRRRGDRKATAPVRIAHVPVGRPAAGRGVKTGPGRRRSFGSRQPVDRVNLLIGLSFVALALIGALWLWNLNQVTVSATGVEPGDTLTPQQAVTLAIEVNVAPTTRLGSAVLTFDGEDVTEDVNVERTDDGFIWRAPPGQGLENGDHHLALDLKRVISGAYHWRVDFAVAPPD